MHDFPGLKPACSLIRCDSTVGVIMFRIVHTVYMYDIRVVLVCSSLESKCISLAKVWQCFWIVSIHKHLLIKMCIQTHGNTNEYTNTC